MLANLLELQEKLVTSQADLVEWSDGCGAGKTFGALCKAATTKGKVLYVTPQANKHFKDLPEVIFWGFKKTFVDLVARNTETEIFFISPESFENKATGMRPSLVVFDNYKPNDVQLSKVRVSGAKVVFVFGDSMDKFYRETYRIKHNTENPHLS